MKDKITSLVSRLFKLPARALGGALKVLFSAPVFLVLGLVVGFLIGARMFETGHISRKAKGANVRVSGPCKVGDRYRKPPLAEDDVKVAQVSDGILTGVVRGTREVVECELSRVAVESLPLLSKLNSSPTKIPDLVAAQSEEPQKDMEVESLLQKTILASGLCLDGTTGDKLPAFTDESLDVVSAERNKEARSISIRAIRRSDKRSLLCASNDMKYTIASAVKGGPANEQAAAAEKESTEGHIKQVIYVTSICFLDHRIPRTKATQKIAFYRLTNSRVQVLEEKLTADKKGILYLAGSALEYGGANIECFNEKYPILFHTGEDEVATEKMPVAQTGEEALEEAKAAVKENSKK